MEGKEYSLQFQELHPIDHVRRCPKYTTISNSGADFGIHLDDLDDLQLEIEELLVSSTQRLRRVKSEHKIVSDIQDNKKDKRLAKTKDDLKRASRNNDEKPPKKMKLQAEVMKPLQSSSSVSSPNNRTKAKIVTPHVEAELVEDLSPRQRGPETPNKFWQMVDTYCGDITPNTIKFLEKLCRPVNKNDEIFKIPELGPHFSQQWSLEDLNKEKDEGRCNESKNNDENGTQQLLKKGYENLQNSEPCPYGSLTQRLVSALVDENVMAPPGSGPNIDGAKFESLTFGLNDPSVSPKSNKSHSIAQTNKLEARIKAELMEQGILENCPQEGEDEILTELKRCQQELYVVSERNRVRSIQLLKFAKNEIKKQELKKKIEIVNQEVVDHYRKVVGARQKKRILMRKEKDAIIKSIKERENLVKQLDQMQPT